MAASYMKKLNFTSYNSTGFGIAAQNYIEKLLLFSDVLCVQEHFLLDSADKNYSNTDKLKVAFGNRYEMIIVPAKKDTNQVSKGRGKGGLVTMWRKCLTKFVTKVSSNHFRLQCIKIGIPNCEVLLINCYFPCDPRSESNDNGELTEMLGEIRSIILSSQCQKVVLAGDLNAHFARQNSFTNEIYNFLENLHLLPLWENSDSDPEHLIHPIDYTYLNVTNNIASSSVIDHFCVSSNVFSDIQEAGVIHDSENLSNHSAIFLKIGLTERLYYGST